MSGSAGRTETRHADAERAANQSAAAGLLATDGVPSPQDALRVVRGYPEPEEVAALVAVLTAVAQSTAAASAAAVRSGAAGALRAPAGGFAHRYQSPTSWQTP